MNVVLKKVNKVYQEVNPSTYFSAVNKKNIRRLQRQRETLFHYKLNLPIELFKNKKLLDLGSGTGMYSIVYNLWGSDCTLVEYDIASYKKSREIFSKFQRKNSINKFVNKDIFKFKENSLYDIVHCNGVLHHTDSKERGIKLMSDNLKRGGILILGVSTITGFFQRNLQRYLLYSISKNKHEIIKNAKIYFGEHLRRASKGSGRSILAVIYDSYINSQIDSYDLQDLLKSFKKNKINFYSSFPMINSIDESEMEWKNFKKNNPSKNSLNFSNYLWFVRSRAYKENKHKFFFESLLQLSHSINNISFEKKVIFLKKIKKIQKKINLFSLNNTDCNFPFLDKGIIFFNELETLINILSEKKKTNLTNFLKNTKYLFKGFSGLGMNYFVGFKN
jgi:SAM-dependent methyltransferase